MRRNVVLAIKGGIPKRAGCVGRLWRERMPRTAPCHAGTASSQPPHHKRCPIDPPAICEGFGVRLMVGANQSLKALPLSRGVEGEAMDQMSSQEEGVLMD